MAPVHTHEVNGAARAVAREERQERRVLRRPRVERPIAASVFADRATHGAGHFAYQERLPDFVRIVDTFFKGTPNG